MHVLQGFLSYYGEVGGGISMIDNRNLLNIIGRELKKMSADASIKILTYKKDRSITIEKHSEQFSVIENGYRKIVWSDLDEHEVLKRLKKLQKIEFPRSNKLYLEKER